MTAFSIDLVYLPDIHRSQTHMSVIAEPPNGFHELA